jgi:hypothetical protein
VTRLLFGIVCPWPRVHRWSNRTLFAVGVVAGAGLALVVL